MVKDIRVVCVSLSALVGIYMRWREALKNRKRPKKKRKMTIFDSIKHGDNNN